MLWALSKVWLSLFGFLILSYLLFSVLGLVSWDWSFSVLGLVLSDFDFDVLINDVSLVCVVMLGFCGSIALFYCFHYFGGAGEAVLLFPLMVWFLGVMGLLVISGSLLLSLVLWEYLGLVSFFLILFYSNGASLRASLITLFASRFGDVALFVLIAWVSWWGSVSSVLLGGLLLMVVLTKSACYPFISWLLEAMRAPTPVSSLVHSSTLVAAGVWYFFRYDLIFSSGTQSVLLVLSLLTVIVSGLSALFFNDLKKLVALSTCNNVSWCLIFFVCGGVDLALLQLFTHGVCKCYLFMVVGDLMSLSGSSQSAVGVYLSRYCGPLGAVLQTLLILSLCGLPFLGVFFSKHELLSGVSYVFGWGYLMLLFVGFFLSYAYSFRFVLLLLKGLGGLSMGYSSAFLLIAMLSVVGTIINFSGLGVFVENGGLSVSWSLAMLMLQIGGCFMGFFFFVFASVGRPLVWSSLVFSDSIVKGIYDAYLSLSSLSFISFYRWELYALALWPRPASAFMAHHRSLFSFNLLVFSVVFILFFLFLMGL